MNEKNCLNCGGEIPEGSGRRKYCSEKCAREVKNRQMHRYLATYRPGQKREPIFCKICGQPVESPRTAYCSKECAREGKLRKSRKRDKEASLQLRQREPIFCKVCGKPVEPPRVVYCSEECAKESLIEAPRRQTIEERLAQLPPRPFERDTVFLAHKYTREGMTRLEAAFILNRCLEDVDRALATPLTPGQEATIQRYYYPYKRRRLV